MTEQPAGDWPPPAVVFDPTLGYLRVRPLGPPAIPVTLMTFDEGRGLWNRVRPGHIDNLERRIRRLEVQLARLRPKKRRR